MLTRWQQQQVMWLVLRLVVRETASGRVVYEKAAARFGVIRYSNGP